MSEPFIELRKVRLQYAGVERPVLDGLDLVYDAGRVGIIGPNGSGKTTVFQCIMGLITPNAGQVLFQGQEMKDEKAFRELRRQVGMVFQNVEDQLFSPTVLEDVAFGPLNMGLAPAEARRCAVETLEMLGLAGFEERVTHNLSGGEKKLVALATVLSMRPRALLLDEPTNDLDPETRHRLIHILRELDCGLAIISHDWDFLAQTIDDVWAMQDGSLHAKERSALHVHHHVHLGGDVPHDHGDLAHAVDSDHRHPHEPLHSHPHEPSDIPADK